MPADELVDSPGPLSRSVKIIAWLFIAVGVLAAGEFVYELTQSRVMLSVSLLFPLVGYGLLRRRDFWRKCALAAAALYAVSGLLLGVAALVWGVKDLPAGADFSMSLLGRPVAPPLADPLALPLLLGTAITIVLVAAWAARVLTAGDVKRQFAAA